MSIGSVVKKVVDYPLEKVASPESSYRKKAFYGAVIFGLSLASFLVYAGYACYYFANRKVVIEDSQKHSKTTGIANKILHSKSYHKQAAKFYQPEFTDLIKKEQTLTRSLAEKFVASDDLDKYYQFNSIKADELKFIYDALLSFHELMNEIVNDDGKRDSFENAFFKASYLSPRPHMLTFELKEPGIHLSSLHLWGRIMREYAPKGHENVLAFTRSRADYNRNFHLYLNSLEDNMDKKTEEYCLSILCDPLYSKDGCIELHKGKFKKESS